MKAKKLIPRATTGGRLRIFAFAENDSNLSAGKVAMRICEVHADVLRGSHVRIVGCRGTG